MARRTADSIEESKSLTATSGENTESRKRSLANLKPWKPGQSGNPSGRRKHDKAKEISQEIFEQNEAAIYTAMGKSLLKGNAYTFKELAERAYGKLTDKLQHSGELKDGRTDLSRLSDTELADLRKLLQRARISE